MTASLADLLSAKTKLADGESPSTLSPATISEVSILFDDDDNPATPSILTNLHDMIVAGPGYDGSGRMDIVFGQGYEGELYILNKRHGWIYQVTNTIPTGLVGDCNSNGAVDAADYTVWRDSLGASFLPNRNPNLEGAVRQADFEFWKPSLAGLKLPDLRRMYLNQKVADSSRQYLLSPSAIAAGKGSQLRESRLSQQDSPTFGKSAAETIATNGRPA